MVKLIFFSYFFFFLVSNSFCQNILIEKQQVFYGVKDENGRVLIPFIYDLIIKDPLFSYYYLIKDNKSGVIDSLGTVILECKFDNIESVAPGMFFVTENNKTAIYCNHNRKFSQFGKLKYVSKISPRLSACKIDSDLLIINKLNRSFCKINYDSIAIMFQLKNERQNTSMFSFFDTTGYFAVYKDHLKGIVDQSFNRIIPVEFDEVELKMGNWYVKLGDTYGVYGSKGNLIIPAGKYQSIRLLNTEFYLVKNKSAGIYGSNGKILIPTEFDEIVLMDNYFKVQKKSNYGIFDPNGKMVIPVEYQGIEKLAWYFKVRKNKKFGIANQKGKILISPNWDGINAEQNRVFIVARYEKGNLLYGLISVDNEAITKLIYTNAKALGDDYFVLYQGSKANITNGKGLSLFEGNYGQVEYKPQHKLFLVQASNANTAFWGVINLYDQVLLDTLYSKHSIELKENEINVKVDTCLINISLDASSRLIEKVVYKNYIEAKLAILGDNYWSTRQIEKDVSAWVLFSPENKPLIPTYFERIDRDYLGNNKITAAKCFEGYFSIIDDRKAKILYDSLLETSWLDFRRGTLVRIKNIYGLTFLMSRKLVKSSAEYRFISAIENGLALVNKGGKLSRKIEGYPIFSITDRSDSDLFSRYQSCVGGKWGLIDENGNELITCKYDLLQKEFNNKLIAVQKNRWGIIDKQQNVLIPFMYDEIRFFLSQKKGPAKWVNCKYYMARKGINWGVIDEENKEIVKFEYQNIDFLPNEYGDFFVVTKNSQQGLINTDNKIIIPVEYAKVEYLDTASRSFYKVSHCYSLKSIRNYPLMGYMNSGFEFGILPRFFDAEPFENNFAKVSMQPKKYSFINRSGLVVSRELYDEARNFRMGKAAVKLLDLWGYIDTTGNMQIAPKYWKARDFYGNVAAVGVVIPSKFFRLIKSRKKMVLINSAGKKLESSTFRDIMEFDKGFAIAQKKRNFGLIDTSAKIRIPIKYSAIRWLSGYNLVVAVERGKGTKLFGIIAGEFKLISEFDRIGLFSEGFAQVRVGGKYGFIDSTGKIIITPKYDFVSDFSCGLAKVGNKGWYGFVNRDSLVRRLQYRECEDFRYNCSKVRTEQKYFYISQTFDTIKPAPYVAKKVVQFKANRGFEKYGNEVNLVDRNMRKIGASPFLDVKWFDNEHFIIKERAAISKIGIYDYWGRVIVPSRFEYISTPNQGLSVIKVSKLIGLYNYLGEIVLPVEYLDVSLAKPNIFQVSTVSKTVYYSYPKRRIL